MRKSSSIKSDERAADMTVPSRSRSSMTTGSRAENVTDSSDEVDQDHMTLQTSQTKTRRQPIKASIDTADTMTTQRNNNTEEEATPTTKHSIYV